MENKDNKNKGLDKEVKKKKLIKGYIRLLVNILVLVMSILVIFTRVFSITIVTGIDMFPSIKDGDVLLSYRLEKDFRKGDVVVYRTSDGEKTGRIVAIGGDTVEIKKNGEFLVNNTVQTEEVVFPTYPMNNENFSIQLEKNEYYILGDYRTEAKDSRYYGTIEDKQIVAKVISIFRRRGI